MKPLSNQARSNIEGRISRGEITKDNAISVLRSQGYDTSTFDDSLSDDSLGDDILQELQAFAYGMPEGASFGLYETDQENVEDAYSFYMPWL